MDSTRRSYRLRRFEKASDPDFASAMLLYVRNTAGPIRTESNQITSWLDTPPADFRGTFYVFGFYLNDQIVAFAQACFFPQADLLTFDYLVIEESMRRNNIFFELTDHLRQYFEDAQPAYRYVVAEVGYGPSEQFPSRNSQLIARLLKIQGFRIVKAPYYQPRLIWEDAETEMRADLLLFIDETSSCIQRETYLRIVRTLYYDYYLPWMNAHTTYGTVYRIYLDQLLEKIEKALGRSRTVEINGHSTVLQPTVNKSLPQSEKVIKFPLQALAIVIILAAAMLALRQYFHLTDTSLAFIFLLALLSFMATAGVVSKDARDMFERLAVLFNQLFYRKVDDSRPSATRKVGPEKRGRALPQGKRGAGDR